MRKIYWYSALAGFETSLLFNVITSSISDVGVDAWLFLIFCLCCFILFATMPWFRRNLRAVPRPIFSLLLSFGSFALGAIAYGVILLLTLSVTVMLWRPQIL